MTGAGGTAPLTYSVSPSLPTGLSLASATGAISGTPTVTSAATTYTVTVTDANNATATARVQPDRQRRRDGDAGHCLDDSDAGHAATSFTPVTGCGGTAPLSYSVSPACRRG